ncbi:CHAP domain-containing protein [Rhizohabitans arisaemae]|uniref:CHAP domain-containing protein n=1 Tax=Rhizohabitans arisaemae TaxID=2720610 RepID=UPI0024B1CC70|nr:CHAP domain-containing protein [Rhizohabitans arisaemae]
MTPETLKLIQALEAELGYTEKSSGYSKFGEWYGQNVAKDSAFANGAWCNMYISWAASKTGTWKEVGQFAYTPYHATWFQQKGAWNKEAAPGALVFFDWSGGKTIAGIDHVGVVTKVEGNTIHTIEGNIDGGVAKRKVRDESKVVGYGHPDIVREKNKSSESEVTTTTTAASTTPAAPAPELTAVDPLTGTILAAFLALGGVKAGGGLMSRLPFFGKRRSSGKS